MKRKSHGYLFVSFIWIIFLSACMVSGSWAGERTIKLKGINQLLAPAKRFQGVRTLNLNKADGEGWHTDYVVRKTGNNIEIGYCEYFSSYTDDKYGDITVNLGDYTFSLDQIGAEGFKLDKNGLRIVCKDGPNCITNVLETSRSDNKGRNIPGTSKEMKTTLSEVHLYFVDKEKQQNVKKQFQNLFSGK